MLLLGRLPRVWFDHINLILVQIDSLPIEWQKKLHVPWYCVHCYDIQGDFRPSCIHKHGIPCTWPRPIYRGWFMRYHKNPPLQFRKSHLKVGSRNVDIQCMFNNILKQMKNWTDLTGDIGPGYCVVKLGPLWLLLASVYGQLVFVLWPI